MTGCPTAVSSLGQGAHNVYQDLAHRRLGLWLQAARACTITAHQASDDKYNISRHDATLVRKAQVGSNPYFPQDQQNKAMKEITGNNYSVAKSPGSFAQPKMRRAGNLHRA